MNAPSSQHTSAKWVLIAVLVVGIAISLFVVFSGAGGGGRSPAY
jgi:hypothetical protein